jgi:DNA-directed RNA polymerase subunit RPC12/RpoP
MRNTKSIVEYLNEHVGQEFCTACLSQRLFNGRGIDVVMRHVEGFGVLRRHAQCSACGHARLVAGVTAN